MFKFKLKPLLTLKENLEEAKKRELGILNTKYQEKKDAQELLSESIKNTYQELKKCREGHIDFAGIQHYQYFLAKQQSEATQMKEEIRELEKKIDFKKDELLSAIKERKIFENLQEMKKEEYMEQEKEKEQKIADEIVSYKYTQKVRGK